MTKSILLADDSVTIQKVVELTFMDEDFRVSAVSNGAEAIARLGESKPDVVIADVHMPGADGYEVCRRSKELYAAVPVLLLVGTFEAFDADEAIRCGADGHLKKPFDSQELMRRVRELVSAPSRSVPVPSATMDEALEAPAAGGEELWEPVGDEMLPLEETPAPEARAEIATRFVPLQSRPEPVPPAPAGAAPVAALAAGGGVAAVAESATEPGTSPGLSALSETDIDRIARRMIELIGDKAVRDVAWEVVPDLAEVLLKGRIRELEASID